MSGQQRQFDIIQEFKKEVEEMMKDEKMMAYTGKAFGNKYAEEWLRLFSEHFSIEEIYSDDDLETFFQEKLEEGSNNFQSIAHDFVVGQFDNGDLSLEHLINLDNEDHRLQLYAFVQANFTREEMFPETKPIGISDSVSGEVSRQVETLEAQNAKLVAENIKLQQQLQAIKSLLHAN